MPAAWLSGKGTADEIATQAASITRKGVERVIRFAFELARKLGPQKSSDVRQVHCHDLAGGLWPSGGLRCCR